MKPNANRDADEGTGKLGFDYDVVSIENDNTVVIKVDFDSPEEISMDDGYDQIKVQIDRTEFKKAFIILGDSNRIIELPADEKINMTMNVPLQMPKEASLVQAQE